MRRFMSFVYELKDKGLFDEYSEEHILIKAMNDELDFFKRYPYLKHVSIYKNNQESDFASNFLINFSIKLHQFSKCLSERDFEEFVLNQLAAGKSNYDEDQFFRALSEIHVLLYTFNWVGEIDEIQYEPRLVKGDTNPEARILYKDKAIFDIEVKTPGFELDYEFEEKYNLLIKPNIILNSKNRKKLSKYCDKKHIQLQFPRVLKLKEFIKSASSKFQEIKNEHHYNLLFINWTYTDFPELKLNEPLTLLTNPNNGILTSKESLKDIGLNISDVENISAIVLYRDSFDTIFSGDFRFHLAHDSVKVIPNIYFNTKNDYETLNKMLKLPSFKWGIFSEWFPSDYSNREGADEKVLLDACDYVYSLAKIDSDILLYESIDNIKKFERGK
jgi:hypothetical protein